ncbi:CPBP family intramembrane glutamic endopeptidase [Paenibacillus segetis]|uniref:CAAX prenyl protease 2/Lysostaphin resistance protein A-like domain-containing protein n=1 Tax=Paenibacillus segetis TaxID=1325360 RepID=A0ABQ1YQ31_9BACL|nr:CPBP family intramembrane glutamic endopeptidase [Paenibacillus segetis]GGH34452.1 hypothetical protein GCM10008013_40190 [Paenibacillus segetis]
MKAAVNPIGRNLKTRTLWILAAIGLIIFVYVQVLPSILSDTLQVEQSKNVITKDQAKNSAAKFMESTLGISGDMEKALVTYEAHSEMYGYLTKEKLMESYLKSYGEKFPLEMFRVRFENPDAVHSAVTVDVHLTTGQVVGFEKIGSAGNSTKDLMLLIGSESTESLLAREGNLGLNEKDALATKYLKVFGFDRNKLDLVSEEDEVGIRYQFKGYTSGQSQGYLDFRFEYGQVSSMESYFDTPQAHLNYVKDQTQIAYWLTFGGYALLTFVLGILAIIFSVKARRHSSFKRGIFLSSCYFVLTMVGAINMLPYLQKEGGEPLILLIGFVVQGVLSLIMAASVYFSLVGGDGLLRQNGHNLWARAKEPGYGRHILSSMANGYAWAFILLGVQSIIFIILDQTIHFWSTTDASQSPYNLLYPLLFPLLAWVAGIGEEAVYRLFGIPMVKKMVRSTFLASFITTMIWALGHTLYPIYPVITRPIELCIIGLLFSFIFLRYGYIAAVFSHVIFDSILMALSLMFMGGSINLAAGVFYIILPAVVAYVIYLFNPPSKERKVPFTQKREEPLITIPHPEGRL